MNENIAGPDNRYANSGRDNMTAILICFDNNINKIREQRIRAAMLEATILSTNHDFGETQNGSPLKYI